MPTTSNPGPESHSPPYPHTHIDTNRTSTNTPGKLNIRLCIPNNNNALTRLKPRCHMSYPPVASVTEHSENSPGPAFAQLQVPVLSLIIRLSGIYPSSPLFASAV